MPFTGTPTQTERTRQSASRLCGLTGVSKAPLVGFEWWGRGTCPLVDVGPVPMLMLQKRTETVCFVELCLR